MNYSTPENLILLCGELVSDGACLYTDEGEDFFEFTMKVVLPTGTDLLKIVIGNSLIDETIKQGAVISVTGRLMEEERSFEGGIDSVIKVFVTEVYCGETEITSGVFLTGNVIRKPYSYDFQDGERAEFQIAVGAGEKPLCVPVSATGENVATAKTLGLGDVVSVLGQLHSFEYLDLNDAGSVTKTAYEVEILTFTALPKI